MQVYHMSNRVGIAGAMACGDMCGNSFSITETSVNFFRLFVGQVAISLVEYYVVVVVAICYAQSAVWMAKMLLNVNS